jgi:hypothetical protein
MTKCIGFEPYRAPTQSHQSGPLGFAGIRNSAALRMARSATLATFALVRCLHAAVETFRKREFFRIIDNAAFA